ncbi:MAG: hypothetical protein K5685_00285 [Bacteroidales bacterium]|nr:hypothetical protein [Bacteroidales bacterium]
MKKIFSAIILLLIISTTTKAQDVLLKLGGNDTTFNAAEDRAKTSGGFDVDTSKSKLNVINLAMQIAQDVAFATGNQKEVIDNLPFKSYYRQRADLIMSAALPGRTNIYFTGAFLQEKEGVKDAARVIAANLEIEHYFRKNMKIRFGRLGNSVSESQFFGRIGLEETSAHNYGRKIYINDAVEFDGAFSKTGPIYFAGIKPVFKPVGFKGMYAGMVFPFQSGLKLHYIVGMYRNFESDSVSKKVYFDDKESYFACEVELAQKWKKATLYVNAGSTAGYRGLYYHTSGPFDFIRQMRPAITDKESSFKENFITAGGVRIFPAKMSKNWKFLQQVGLEGEIVGGFSDDFTAVNLCAYARINLTKRLVLTYYCTPEFVDQSFNKMKPEKVSGVVNFFRLSVTAGSPGRLYM